MKGFWLLFALLAVVFRKRILSVVKLLARCSFVKKIKLN